LVPEQQLNLNDYIEIAKRRKWSFVFPFLGIVVAAVLVGLFLQPVYRSTATILIEEQDIPPEFVMSTVNTYVEQRLQSINQRIMSTSRLMDIIKRFDLYADQREKLTTEEIIEKMREDVILEPISADVVDRRTGRATTATIAFALSYEAPETPRKVLQVSDVLTSLFLQENLQIRSQQAEDISSFLQDEQQHQKAELEKMEKEISTFKEKHINELPEMLQINLQARNDIERRLEMLQSQLKSVRERESYLQAELANTEPGGRPDHPDEQRLEELKIELAYLKSRVSEAHPDMKKLRAEIQEMESQVYPAGKRSGKGADLPDNPAYITLSSQLASTRSEIQFIKEQIGNLEEERKEYNRRIEATPRIEEEYNTLLLERTTARSKYDELMRKIMEARVSHDLEKEQKGERFTLIDPPRLPEKPVRPNILLITLIGVVIGFGAGLGTASLRELSDQSVWKPDTLSSQTLLPVLASIREILIEEDIQQRSRRRKMVWIGALATLVVGVVVFHFFVMDLDIFWAKVMRRLAI
jgi:polysaccharide chain length determinant protein (PEP-CTERM system associated)